ncbi:hypothetical protein K488DRAFT_80885 [Vararia minispora EC-137]|uniref:Uncharacterized protein n=1 Tax=Vararia minispora EC-137 TaxID=1314806 RepID=A0ACB8Q9V0_9AGAM|nr:hypothetical protein K488DRAFT_80885 [Vararia minispora EC-137]
MSSDEEDYLSDKFLSAAAPAPIKPNTYAELRRQAQRRAEEKNLANRTKTLREREREAREEGLGKTLFERAAEADKGTGAGNKALQMMMKMGFQPGNSLGRTNDDGEEDRKEKNDSGKDEVGPSRSRPEGQLVNPLPLKEWAGKQGIGVGKRAAEELEHATKVARVAQERDATSYRERARGGFEVRRAEARLGSVQRTCIQLDERAGVEYNVLWLNTESSDAFPEGLWQCIVHLLPTDGTSRSAQLRHQMYTDALRPLSSALDDVGPDEQETKHLDPDVVEHAITFLQLDPVERLVRVLKYLRERYHYCFWCGTQYTDEDDMAQNCPGPEEDMHD